MTEHEAIKDIKRQLLEINSEDADITLSTESLRMAIKALEKQESLKKFIELMKTTQYECFVTDRNGVVDILDAFLIDDWE